MAGVVDMGAVSFVFGVRVGYRMFRIRPGFGRRRAGLVARMGIMYWWRWRFRCGVTAMIVCRMQLDRGCLFLICSEAIETFVIGARHGSFPFWVTTFPVQMEQARRIFA